MSNWRLSDLDAQSIAIGCGIELKPKVNKVFQASDNAWEFAVPVAKNPIMWQPFNPEERASKSAFEVVKIPLKLYRNESGASILMGYDNEHSILVWANHKPAYY